MRRELHVRFSEGAGVKLPRATRLVVLFETEYDARRVMKVLALRLEKYGLRLHPEKTRLLEFRPKPASGGGPRRRSFDFLDFTLFWAKSIRGRGWYVSAKTSRR